MASQDQLQYIQVRFLLGLGFLRDEQRTLATRFFYQQLASTSSWRPQGFVMDATWFRGRLVRLMRCLPRYVNVLQVTGSRGSVPSTRRNMFGDPQRSAKVKWDLGIFESKGSSVPGLVDWEMGSTFLHPCSPPPRIRARHRLKA